MDKQRKGVVSGALHVAGEAVKLGLGIGVLSISRLGSLVRGAISNGNKAVKSASTTVGDGISDAKQASGHVAEAAEALIVEFGHTFQAQAGAPADVKEEPASVKVAVAAKAIKPVRKTAAKKSPAAKTTSAAKPAIEKAAVSPAKAKVATKAKAPLKAKVKASADAAGKPAGTAVVAEGSGSPTAAETVVPRPATIRKSAAKKPVTKATKPKSAATAGVELAPLTEPTPPPNKLH
jgi:hypothetical protein